MKSMIGIQSTVLAATVAACFLLFASSAAAQFEDVEWSSDKNLPTADVSGSGETPNPKDVKIDGGPHRFTISTDSTSDKQRQEWKFERRKGLVQMQTIFRISEKHRNFDRIALAQNHDDQTGSKGVFSIYQVRRVGNSYYFGVQGDTEEAKNSYKNFSTVKIQLGKFYGLRLQSYINGRNGSFEVAELYEDGKIIWREGLKGGGDKEGYYKIGVYKLSKGKGKITAEFKNTQFWTGEPGKKRKKNKRREKASPKTK